MSHFGVLVIADRELDRDQAESYVAEVLEPYNENTEVPEYERDCYCVGRIAEKEAMDSVEAAGHFNERREAMRKEFSALRKDIQAAQPDVEFPFMSDEPKSWECMKEDHPRRDEFRAREEALDERWAALHAEYDRVFEVAVKNHPSYAQPNPDCPECKGSGKEMSVYNPLSKWDYWLIGGRWTGAIDPECEDGERPCADVKPMADLPEGWEEGFYAYVTPDGEWHERGRMGWFGMSSGDKPREEWRAELREVGSAHIDGTAIVVDCHI